MVYVMGTFSSLFLAIISSQLLNPSQKNNRNLMYRSRAVGKLFRVLSVVPLAVLSGVRYQVGTDFMNYNYIYESKAVGYESREPFFSWIVKCLNMISSNPQFFFFITSVFICGSYYLAIYRVSKAPIFSILLFVISQEYFRSMNGIRQYLALAIMLFAIPSMVERKWKIVIPTIVVAYFMHNSAIVILGVYLLYEIVLRFKPIILCIGAAVMLFISSIFLQVILPILERYTTFLRYFAETSSYSEGRFTFSYFIIYGSFFLFILYLYYLEKAQISDGLLLMLSAVFIGAALSSISVIFPNNIYRVFWYVDPFIVIYTPEMLKQIKDKRIEFFIRIIIMAAFSYLCIRSISLGTHNAVPYHAYWNI